MLIVILPSFHAFQEPQMGSRERQKPIMLGSSPSNQAA